MEHNPPRHPPASDHGGFATHSSLLSSCPLSSLLKKQTLSRHNVQAMEHSASRHPPASDYGELATHSSLLKVPKPSAVNFSMTAVEETVMDLFCG